MYCFTNEEEKKKQSDVQDNKNKYSILDNIPPPNLSDPFRNSMVIHLWNKL